MHNLRDRLQNHRAMIAAIRAPLRRWRPTQRVEFHDFLASGPLVETLRVALLTRAVRLGESIGVLAALGLDEGHIQYRALWEVVLTARFIFHGGNYTLLPIQDRLRSQLNAESFRAALYWAHESFESERALALGLHSTDAANQIRRDAERSRSRLGQAWSEHLADKPKQFGVDIGSLAACVGLSDAHRVAYKFTSWLSHSCSAASFMRSRSSPTQVKARFGRSAGTGVGLLEATANTFVILLDSHVSDTALKLDRALLLARRGIARRRKKR